MLRNIDMQILEDNEISENDESKIDQLSKKTSPEKRRVDKKKESFVV